jgi:hypothetical protein
LMVSRAVCTACRGVYSPEINFARSSVNVVIFSLLYAKSFLLLKTVRLREASLQ